MSGRAGGHVIGLATARRWLRHVTGTSAGHTEDRAGVIGGVYPMNVDLLEARLAAAGGGPGGSGSGRRRECADQVLDRVARTLGDVERRHGGGPGGARAWTERFRALMAQNRFWPSLRILHNCGTRYGQLASWYVLPLADDFDG